MISRGTISLASTFCDERIRPFLAVSLLLNINHFLMLSQLGVVAENHSSVSAISIAGLLAVRGLIEHATTPFSGILADALGYRRVLCLASAVKIFAYLILAYTLSYQGFLVFAILHGVSNAHTKPSLRSWVSIVATDIHLRRAYFNAMYIAMNLGVVAGPLLLYPLSSWHWASLAFLFAAIIELCGASIIFMVRSPTVPPEEAPLHAASRWLNLQAIRPTLTSQLMNVYALQFLYWMGLGMTITLTVLIDQISPTLSPYRSLLLSTEGIATIVWQGLLFPRAKYFTDRTKHFAGGIAIASGVAFFCLGKSVFFPLVGVIVCALGDAVVSPLLYAHVAEYSPQHRRGFVYSLLILSGGLGEATGNLVGGVLLMAQAQHKLLLPTMGTLIATIMGTAFLFLSAQNQRLRERYA